MQLTEFKPGDTFSMDTPDFRWWVRAWCWIARKDLPVRRENFKVTHITSAGARVSVR